MPRTQRVAPGGMVFHVLNRGVGRQKIFASHRDYEAFEEAVAETLQLYPMRVLAYCLMPNNWHFILWPKEEGPAVGEIRKQTAHLAQYRQYIFLTPLLPPLLPPERLTGVTFQWIPKQLKGNLDASMYSDVIKLIERSKVAFPKIGNGVSHLTVSGAEVALGIPLPESYKWWLLNYGGGQIKGDVVYGLDEDGMGRPDIVELARMNEQDGLYDKNRLVFSMGDAETFFFDTTVMQNGEYQVFTHDIMQDEMTPYARHFVDYLQRRIREMYGVV